MAQKETVLGLSLIMFGAILLLAKMGILALGWSTLWPLFVLLPGLILEGAYIFNREIPGILVPGGILTIVGLNLFICVNFSWGWTYLWPLFPFSVAFGLFQLYIFDNRDRALLLPIAIIGGVSIIAFLSTLATALVGGIIPFAIILFGAYFIYKGRQQKKNTF